MKVKLLKKVRKQYSIVYFPKGSEVYGLGVYNTDIYHLKCTESFLDTFYGTREECLNRMIRDVRSRFGNKNNKNTNGIKIWYNKMGD